MEMPIAEAKKLEKAKKLFPGFVRELKKYAPGVHCLKPGTSEDLIQFAETKLKVNFPKSYREFLAFWNGAALFKGDTMVFGIHKSKKYVDEEEFPVEDLIESNRPKQRWPGMLKSYVLIARTGYGDQICLDMDDATTKDAKVVQWSHEEGGTEKTHKNLAAWLEWEMKMGRGAYDYKGNEL
jgi:hypothetical protein